MVVNEAKMHSSPFSPHTRSAARRGRSEYLQPLQLNGRAPPHSIEIEQGLLGCCLLDEGQTLSSCIRKGVEGRMFYSAANRAVFDSLAAIYQGKGIVDIGLLAQQLTEAKRLDGIGGPSFLAEISTAAPTTISAPIYIEKLLAFHIQRERIRLCAGQLEALYAGDAAAADENDARLREITSLIAGELPPILGFSDFVGTVQTALPPELVGGLLHLGSKLMIAGGSKSFKTWVLLDLGLSVATGTPWWGMRTIAGRVLYLNLEIARSFCEHRVRTIMLAKQIKEAPGFDSWHLRGFARDFKQLMPQIERAIRICRRLQLRRMSPRPPARVRIHRQEVGGQFCGLQRRDFRGRCLHLRCCALTKTPRRDRCSALSPWQSASRGTGTSWKVGSNAGNTRSVSAAYFWRRSLRWVVWELARS